MVVFFGSCFFSLVNFAVCALKTNKNNCNNFYLYKLTRTVMMMVCAAERNHSSRIFCIIQAHSGAAMKEVTARVIWVVDIFIAHSYAIIVVSAITCIIYCMLLYMYVRCSSNELTEEAIRFWYACRIKKRKNITLIIPNALKAVYKELCLCI